MASVRAAEVAEILWELKRAVASAKLSRAKLTVSVKDCQGNLSKFERMFSIR